jgi:membrane associated rhomboid family serine protease
MFPLYDENPTVRPAVAMMVILGLNIAAWVFVQGMGADMPLARSLCLYGLIPGELLGTAPLGIRIELGPNLTCSLEGTTAMTLLYHMFLHGGWLHIVGNMWFLWIFGDNVEDAMGAPRFLAFYLLCGLAAAFAQIITAPGATLPMVGASGAIGGVMGGYMRLYPRARIITLVPVGFYAARIALPAIAMLGYWFILQLASGLPALGATGGGVAFWAHVGGFVAGFVLVGPFSRPEYLAERRRLGV